MLMHTTNELLDTLSAKHENASDYRLAKLLATSTSVITRYRKGGSSLSPDFAIRVAQLLEWEPAYVLACVERERAEKDSRVQDPAALAATWERIAERFRPVVPGILLACLGAFFGLNPSSTQARTITTSTPSEPSAIYIMRIRRFARRWLRLWFPALDPSAALAA